METPHYSRILVVRTDRIGDVVLSLPMVHVLRASYPAARVSMLLRSYTRELVEGFEGIHELLEYDEEGNRKSIFTMLAEIRSRRFDAVVVSYPTFRLALLMFLARIPVRVGTGYRWYSFLFNRRVFEHRKTAERHEVEYNLSLLRALGCRYEEIPKVSLPVSPEAEEAVQELLESIGISPSESIILLHPGSGGSAREWSPGNFAALARRLHDKRYRVLVTGGSGEEDLVGLVVRESGGAAHPVSGVLTLKELLALCRAAKVLVSNSTGPLHIAAAAGTAVVGLYPPIRECSPRRWGPLTERKVVFTAESAACRRCRGGTCQGSECMDQITVEQVEEAVRKLAGLPAAQRRVSAGA